MRKIEQQVITAFKHGRNCRVGNTESTGNDLYLHGNHIARRLSYCGEFTNGVAVSWAGWTSATTRSRLNAVAQLLGFNDSFSIKDFSAHHNGQPCDASKDNWIILGAQA